MKIVNTLFISCLLAFLSCNGQEKKIPQQNSKTETPNSFRIDNYMILPEKKEVLIKTMVGGKDWDGIEYRKNPKINFDNTTMLLIQNQVLFKEYFPYKYDLETLKIIDTQDEFYKLTRDKKSIYYATDRLQPIEIKISDYEVINDFVYKAKNGTLHFLDLEAHELKPIELKVDENSVKHLVKNYFYDKNGLYYFGSHSKLNSKGYYDDYVENSEKLVDGQNILPKMGKYYFTFNGEVFSFDSGNNIKHLKINSDKIIEVELNSESFITDGKTVYSNLQYGYDGDAKDDKGYYGIWFPTLYSGANIQKIYSPLVHFIKERNSVVINKNDPNDFPGLIARIDDENYLLADKKKSKIEHILFYNPVTKTKEDFDEKYLKIYGNEGFIQYKNALYFDGMPVEMDGFDMEKMHAIVGSNYITDGKSLLYIANIGGYDSKSIGAVEYVLFEDRTVKNAYTKNMFVINPDLLSDGEIIVSEAQKTTIKDLKLNVKIVK